MNMMKRRNLVTVGIFLATVLVLGYGAGILALSGCASDNSAAETVRSALPEGPPNEEGAREGETKSADQTANQLAGPAIDLSGSIGSSWESRVIKTASLEIEVEKGKLKEIANRITMLAESKGGFIKSSQFTSWEESQQALVTIAVPSIEFGAALTSIEGWGDVLSSQSSGQDVTQEYHDLELDLSHWQSERQSVMLLLEKAQTLDEILKVRQFLEPIDRQINEIKGRLEYLTQSSDYSTIQVSLREKGAEPIAAESTFWSKIGDILATSFSGILVILAAGIPWIVLIGLLALLVAWILRRSRRKNPPSLPTPPAG
jgi:hypothetical protein